MAASVNYIIKNSIIRRLNVELFLDIVKNILIKLTDMSYKNKLHIYIINLRFRKKTETLEHGEKHVQS